MRAYILPRPSCVRVQQVKQTRDTLRSNRADSRQGRRWNFVEPVRGKRHVIMSCESTDSHTSCRSCWRCAPPYTPAKSARHDFFCENWCKRTLNCRGVFVLRLTSEISSVNVNGGSWRIVYVHCCPFCLDIDNQACATPFHVAGSLFDFFGQDIAGVAHYQHVKRNNSVRICNVAWITPKARLAMWRHDASD
jgi:hypothetical protein